MSHDTLEIRARKLGCPHEYVRELATLVEEWFYAAAESNTDAGYSIASYADLPALVDRLGRWARKRESL